MLALNVKEYRTYPDGFPTLLNITELVGSGFLFCEDGAITAGYYVSGKDIASMTHAERNQAAHRLNSAFVQHFGAGWVISFELINKPSADYPDASLSHFPDPISQAIEDERRAQFLKEGNHFESMIVLVVRYKPTSIENPKWKRLFYQGKPKETVTSLEHTMAYMERTLQSFEDSLSGVLQLQRMRSYTVEDEFGITHHRDDLVNYANLTITDEWRSINISSDLPLEYQLGGLDFAPGDFPLIGDKYIAAISITGSPGESFPNMLQSIAHQRMACRWYVRFTALEQHQTVGEVKKVWMEWEQQISNPTRQILRMKGGHENLDAAQMSMDAQHVMAQAHSGQVLFGHCTQTIILMHENLSTLVDNARQMVREVKRIGFNCQIETLNATEAWLGTLPGNVHQNLRQNLLHTLHLAHMLPLCTIWTGHEQCPNPLMPPGLPPLLFAATIGATPFRFNLHASDVGHTLILGSTGSGKSVLLAIIAAQFRRYANATICAFDKGRSLWALVDACGGQHFDIGSDQETLSFAPLAQIDSDAEMAWAEDWIATLYEMGTGKTVSPRQQEEIHRAMRLLRKTKAPHQRSLTDFLMTLQRVNDTDDLKTALNHYTHNGAYGDLLDAREDTLTDSTFNVFEIEELMAMKEKIAIPVLLYLFRRFERTLKGQPALLLLDEAWVMLGHPVFREKIRQWLKELRKKNCAVVMATQSLSDAVRSGIYDVLLESCPTKILLPNEEADKTGTAEFPGPRDLYAMMGLNETEIGIIQTARKKREYYYVSPEGRRLFDLGLGPVALSFVGVSDKETLAHLRQLKALHGKQWPFVWLKERRVHVPTLVV